MAVDYTILERDIVAWNKQTEEIERQFNLLTSGQQSAFDVLREQWQSGYDRAKCQIQIAILKGDLKKIVDRELNTTVKGFATLCDKYYTKSGEHFLAFQKKMGGGRTLVPTRTQSVPRTPSPSAPSVRNELTTIPTPASRSIPRLTPQEQELVFGYRFPDGSTYNGQILNGIPHGHGEYRYTDGSWDEGNWYHGKLHGHCKRYDASSQRLEEGDFNHGDRVGRGIITWKNGNRYEGGWNNNGANGEGQRYYAEAQRWDIGTFRDGKRYGRGTVQWPDGTRYEGTWGDDANGYLTGNGFYYYRTGRAEQGRWIAGDWVAGKWDTNSDTSGGHAGDGFWASLIGRLFKLILNFISGLMLLTVSHWLWIVTMSDKLGNPLMLGAWFAVAIYALVWFRMKMGFFGKLGVGWLGFTLLIVVVLTLAKSDGGEWSDYLTAGYLGLLFILSCLRAPRDRAAVGYLILVPLLIALIATVSCLIDDPDTPNQPVKSKPVTASNSAPTPAKPKSSGNTGNTSTAKPNASIGDQRVSKAVAAALAPTPKPDPQEQHRQLLQQADKPSPALAPRLDAQPEPPTAPVYESPAPEPPLTMYRPGDFPAGKIYSIPDLEDLAGKNLNNAWLYGSFKLKAQSGNYWTFCTYFLLGSYSREGSTIVIVEFPYNQYPRMGINQVINIQRHTPLELLSVKKDSRDNIIVQARNRLRM